MDRASGDRAWLAGSMGGHGARAIASAFGVLLALSPKVALETMSFARQATSQGSGTGPFLVSSPGIKRRGYPIRREVPTLCQLP
jgi:hypothetical protein